MTTTTQAAADASQIHDIKGSFLSRLLDPLSRYIEAIYSVLIVLTFTMAARVADATVADSVLRVLVQQLFWASLGCAVAWGLIDGVMYIIASLAERGETVRMARTIKNHPDEEEAIALLGEQLGNITPLMSEEEQQILFSRLHERLKDTPLPTESSIRREDFAGALGTLLVAVLAALPVALPLLLFRNNAELAVRLSNVVAFAMLFVMGYRWARYAGGKPIITGAFLMLVGIVVVMIAIPLGG